MSPGRDQYGTAVPGEGRGAYVARVFPSRAALNQKIQQELNSNPSGVLLRPHYYTFENLLPKLLAQAPLPPGVRALEPWAGPILVQGLIERFKKEAGAFSGVALGRRLPERLWRLLVEIKAAGLRPPDLEGLDGSQQSQPLAWLLNEYNQTLNRISLADQADCMDALQSHLANGGPALPLMRRWARLSAEQVLWLRTLDLRLLRALSLRLPVQVRFSLTPQNQDPLFKLLHAAARYLESESRGDLSISWGDQTRAAGPLSGLVYKALNEPGADYRCPGAERLKLERCAGRYSEVELLAHEALRLVESGVEPNRIALIFTDLSVYGQMMADVAGRIGLPLSGGGQQSLLDSPLVQAVISLLELCLGNLPAQELARVLESPYLSLARWIGGPGSRPDLSQASKLLSLAGYVDSLEGVPEERFNHAARKHPDHQQELLFISSLLIKFKEISAKYSQPNNLKDYLTSIISLLDELGLNRRSDDSAGGPGIAFISGEALTAREITALAGLKNALSQMQAAAGQVQADSKFSAGRCLALVRQVLAQTPGPARRSARDGVQLLRLEEAAGLELHTILVGGLSQSDFPLRPQSQHMLNSVDRLRLGKMAKMPVWRTDDEEYSGQLLNLAWLMSRAEAGGCLTCPAGGADGKETEPSFWFGDLMRGLKREPQRPKAGAFGSLPALPECRDPASLWASLSHARLGHAGSDDQFLAQVMLGEMAARGMETKWRSLATRARVEKKRHELDYLTPDERIRASDAFTGLITSNKAQAVLTDIMGRPPLARVSPSSLEGLAACPMHWFFTRILHLSETELLGWELSLGVEGEWVHETLARFFAPQEYADDWQPDYIEQRLLDCLQKAREHLMQTGSAGHPSLWAGRQAVLQNVLLKVVQSELAGMPPARPKGVEKSFGDSNADVRLAAPLADGHELELVGRLDRLDIAPGLVRITDYKNGRNTAMFAQAVAEEAQGVSAFQLAVYLAAGLALSGADQAECQARLVPTRLPARKPGVIQYAAGDLFLASPDTPGATAQNNLFTAIRALWERTRSGDLAPRPDKDTCKYCQVQGVCRAQVTGQAVEDSA